MGQTKLRCTAKMSTFKLSRMHLHRGTCEALGLLQFDEQCVHQVQNVNSPSPVTNENIIQEYKDVFTGLGKLPGQYHIETNPNVKPVQNNPRRIPIPVKYELKQKINELERMGVIAKVTEPTP